MIKIKSAEEIEKMRKAGRLAASLLEKLDHVIKPGVSTEEINNICEDYTQRHGAQSAPLNYKGFPKSVCTSLNSVVCHGIPCSEDVLEDGDIINVDVTVILNGYHGDTSKTFFVGNVDPEVQEFVKRVEQSMYAAIQVVRPNQHFGEIGARIHRFVKPYNYGIVRALGGHGIGKHFHEEPMVFHHKSKSRGQRMKPGMTFTIEPMINQGSDHEVYIDENDQWTVYTRDGSLSAQFEHTVLVTDKGYEILTARHDNPIPVKSS